jgi:BirA family transcriptional regulator, biotin operon repressor / biotin---[acetyl-CoA-carboxylase] ligase
MSQLLPLRGDSPAMCLFALLREQEGNYVSPQSCATRCGLDETGLHREVELLQLHDAQVEWMPGLGLRVFRKESINAPELLLNAHSHGWPQAALCLAETGSTQKVAADCYARGIGNGLVVTAEHQTEGKGRGGRRWFSEPGSNLLISIVMRKAKLEPLASIRIALVLHDVLQAEGVSSAALRWPNDLLASGGKIGGILMEHAPGGEEEALVVGIGLNVNQDMRANPSGMNRSVSSLFNELGRTVERERLLGDILEAIGKACLREKESEQSLLDRYRGCCRTLGSRLSITMRERVIAGRAVDIGAHGELILERDDGRRERVYSAEAIETMQEEDGKTA